METVKLDAIIGRSGWLGHIILEDDDTCTKIVDTYWDGKGDPEKLQLEITVNGVVVSYEDFQSQLDKWSDMIEDQIKKELDFFTTERCVQEKAEQLIKDKLGNIQEILYNVENELWKL